MAVDFSSEFMIKQSTLILECYEQTTNYSLRNRLDISGELGGEKLARALYEAPVAILSHDVLVKDGRRDNVYTYGNNIALQLFERTFEELISLPSRRCTLDEESPQANRNNILTQCLSQGWVKFDTTRYSASGKEILLRDAVLFNLFDHHGIYCGQAVVFEPVKD